MYYNNRMRFSVDVKGLKELEKTLLTLPRYMRTQVHYRSLMAGAGQVRDAASDNVRKVTSSEASGVLAKNIRVYRLKKKRGWYRVAIRVRKGAVNKRKRDGKGQPVRVGLYGSVLEYGKDYQAPRSWIRKAIREEKNTAIVRVRNEMKRRIPKAVEDAKR